MSPGDPVDGIGGTGGTGQTGPAGPQGAGGTGTGAPAGTGSTAAGAPPAGGTGPREQPSGARDSAAPVTKPSITGLVISLATDQPETVGRPANVVSLASVAVRDEAWLTVVGEHFVEGSLIRINGRPVSTTFEPANSQLGSVNTLTAPLVPAYLPKPTEYRVTVVNPEGGVSNARFLYAEPQPRWGPLEKALVGGALLAAAVWILWMINAPLPGPLLPVASVDATATAAAALTPTPPAASLATAQTSGQEEGPDAAPSREPRNWQLTWFTMFFILAVFAFGVGRALTGTWKSLLIDGRKKQSLSRLQLVLWTGLVTSAIAAALAWNIHLDAEDPLGIHIPVELLALLGISATALVGSNFIKEQQSKPSEDLTGEEADQRLKEISKGSLTADGKLAANTSIVQARWTDMFRSEGIGSYSTFDIGKTQLFFFTVVGVLAYAAAFANTAYIEPPTGASGAPEVTAEAPVSPRGRFEFPSLEASLVGLLGISSFYYLANKAAKEEEYWR